MLCGGMSVACGGFHKAIPDGHESAEFCASPYESPLKWAVHERGARHFFKQLSKYKSPFIPATCRSNTWQNHKDWQWRVRRIQCLGMLKCSVTSHLQPWRNLLRSPQGWRAQSGSQKRRRRLSLTFRNLTLLEWPCAKTGARKPSERWRFDSMLAPATQTCLCHPTGLGIPAAACWEFSRLHSRNKVPASTPMCIHSKIQWRQVSGCTRHSGVAKTSLVRESGETAEKIIQKLARPEELLPPGPGMFSVEGLMNPGRVRHGHAGAATWASRPGP